VTRAVVPNVERSESVHRFPVFLLVQNGHVLRTTGAVAVAGAARTTGSSVGSMDNTGRSCVIIVVVCVGCGIDIGGGKGRQGGIDERVVTIVNAVDVDHTVHRRHE